MEHLIPSSEIKQPSFHADELGFVFVWKGHLLRGIYPKAVSQAKSYFETGFIDEVVSKGLFPKTWISEYKNEQFGIILEHEFIQPTIYATEWNFQMLKDAALMVLDIAQVGLKYGYNMIDCHKLNVMFKNNRPLFVDLGSFVPQVKGCSGWKPYNSFLRSYYYIIDLWSSGCPQLAKRVMAPHVELQHDDYWAYKRPVYRHFPFLLRVHNYLTLGLQEIIVSDYKRFSGAKRLVKSVLDGLRISDSQNLNRIRKRILKKSLPLLETKAFIELDWICEFIHETRSVKTITFINVGNLSSSNLRRMSIKRILSITSVDSVSRQEYCDSFDNDFSLQSLCYDAFVPTFTHGKEPEKRFCSDMVVIGNLNVNDKRWSIHNTIIKLKNIESYSLSGYMAICIKEAEVLISALPVNYEIVEQVPNQGIIVKLK